MAMTRLRLAIVIQRYGEEVNGGAELHARWVAEHLAQTADVTVITTCAIDFMTWANHYPSGESVLNGVTLYRFPVDAPRDWVKSQKQTGRLMIEPHTLFDEIQWLKDSGPYSTPLLEFIRKAYFDFDFFFFYTHHYATAFFGLPLVSDKAIFVPTAHDDPYIRMPVFRALFHLPRAIIYLTEPEKRLVQGLMQNSSKPSAVIGVGLEEPVEASAERFRQTYEIEGDFLLYVGRIHPSKNVPQLFDYFLRFLTQYEGKLQLVLMGKSHLDLPDDPRIIHLGFVSEQAKYDALRTAKLTVMPSLYESLSMILLESWLMETAVLVNGCCEVLKYQCQQSNGGLYYTSYEEFEITLNYLLNPAGPRQQLGQQGFQFVKKNYAWDVVLSKYECLLAELLLQQKVD
jgi:glycosyltransferase involved in cell wall biosynthesis